MKICIIGHKGYIGSALYSDLTEHGINLSGFDIVEPDYTQDEVFRTISNYNLVIYLGGFSGRSQCAKQMNQVVIDKNIIDIMKLGTCMKHNSLLIYASSGGVYEGYGSRQCTERDMINTELLDSYTYSMYLREQNIRTLNHIRTIGLRFGTVIGLSPTQRTDLVHLAMIKSAVLTGNIRVHNPDQFRGVLCLNDLKRVFRSIISKDMNSNDIVGHQIYNVNSFNCTIAKIANQIASQTGAHTMWEPSPSKMVGFSMDNTSISNFLNFSFEGTNAQIISNLISSRSNLMHISASNTNLTPSNDICRACRSDKMVCVVDFGYHTNANSYTRTSNEMMETYPLILNKCNNCHHVQLGYTIDPAKMFSDYIYFSGTSFTLRQYFKDFVTKVESDLQIKSGNVLELACNDGSLLDEFKKQGWKTYGYDPAKNIYEISKGKGHDITVGFWGLDPVPSYPPLDVIVAQNVVAHVPDPIMFLSKCREVMNDSTVLYVQTSQSNIIEDGQFDTVYHEHLSFFNVNSMKTAVEKAGLALEHVEKVPIHGISYVFKIKKASDRSIELNPIYKREESIGLYHNLAYVVFDERVKELKSWLIDTLEYFNHEKGIPIVGYGAAAKGMTILNYVGKLPLGYIVDDSVYKHSYYATNNHYLIVPPNTLETCDSKLVVLVLAWNFLKEIKQKIINYRKGKETYIVVPFPRRAIYHISSQGKCIKIYEYLDRRYSYDSLTHKTALVSHFYNEEMMLKSWIRHHAPHFDHAILIDHHSTDHSRQIILNEAPESWIVVDSSQPNDHFDTIRCDQEVVLYENKFNDTNWKIALTTTEFLHTISLRHRSNRTFDAVKYSADTIPNALMLRSVSIVDTDHKLSQVVIKPNKKFYPNSLYNRFIHNLPHNNHIYNLGRHTINIPYSCSKTCILKYLFAPYPEFISRKLQISKRLDFFNDKNEHLAHHDVNFDQLMEKYNEAQNVKLYNMSDIDSVLELGINCPEFEDTTEQDQTMFGIEMNSLQI